MAKKLHKRFSTEEVKMLLRKYLDEKVELAYILEILKIKRRRFFELLKEYRKDPVVSTSVCTFYRKCLNGLPSQLSFTN